MTKRDWSRVDEDGWIKLRDGLEYTQTHVWVYQERNGRWTFKIVNMEDTAQTDLEAGRVRGEARASASWRTQRVAKRHAMAARFRRDYLEMAGISFKD